MAVGGSDLVVPEAEDSDRAVLDVHARVDLVAEAAAKVREAAGLGGSGGGGIDGLGDGLGGGDGGRKLFLRALKMSVVGIFSSMASFSRSGLFQSS